MCVKVAVLSSCFFGVSTIKGPVELHIPESLHPVLL
jgi:CRISPR/Cas system type I-B associated protein Csh2 (Cas7 group RAMP superfamily)